MPDLFVQLEPQQPTLCKQGKVDEKGLDNTDDFADATDFENETKDFWSEMNIIGRKLLNVSFK